MVDAPTLVGWGYLLCSSICWLAVVLGFSFGSCRCCFPLPFLSNLFSFFCFLVSIGLLQIAWEHHMHLRLNHDILPTTNQSIASYYVHNLFYGLACIVVLSRTRHARISLAYYLECDCWFTLFHRLWPKNSYLSQMKNQHGHWLCRCRCVERTV